jgi:hypothetical protein
LTTTPCNYKPAAPTGYYMSPAEKKSDGEPAPVLVERTQTAAPTGYYNEPS